LSSDQIKQLYDTIDRDQNGVIDYEEFLHSFEVVDTAEDEEEEGKKGDFLKYFEVTSDRK
jgi:Ca2+-binding EF-hand superfamily protein